jgi:hypothetical protein
VLVTRYYNYIFFIKGKVAPVYTMKAYGRVEVQLSSFLASTQMEVSGQLHDPATSCREEPPIIH